MLLVRVRVGVELGPTTWRLEPRDARVDSTLYSPRRTMCLVPSVWNCVAYLAGFGVSLNCEHLCSGCETSKNFLCLFGE